jgi:hypothetical protein
MPGPAPRSDAFHYADGDGGWLLFWPTLIPDVGPGVYFSTDPAGPSVAMADLPALITSLQAMVDAAAKEG